jgi:hypothetical protein
VGDFSTAEYRVHLTDHTDALLGSVQHHRDIVGCQAVYDQQARVQVSDGGNQFVIAGGSIHQLEIDTPTQVARHAQSLSVLGDDGSLEPGIFFQDLAYQNAEDARPSAGDDLRRVRMGARIHPGNQDQP